MLGLIRLVVFGVVSLFGLIILGLGADILATLNNADLRLIGSNYAGLAVATGVLTLLTLPGMLAIDLLRTGAITSLIWVELLWLGILWVLWLATGATAAQWAQIFFSGTKIAQETQAIAAFGFLGWLALIGYWGFLLATAIIAHQRGQNGVWHSSVKEHQTSPAGTTNTGFVHNTNTTTAPQMGHAYPPAGTPAATPAQQV